MYAHALPPVLFKWRGVRVVPFLWSQVLIRSTACGAAVERWKYFQRIDPAEFQHRDTLRMALTKHLVVIGTSAANAPYIGLLGTVLSIMLTFHTMGTSGAAPPHEL